MHFLIYLMTAIATLAGPGEPGKRMVVHGRVFDASGTKAVAGVTVHAYHTDAKGIYNLPLQGGPRLKATVKTDAQGRFELRTIRPGSYPLSRNPAHIHFELSGAGYPKQWTELRFADDPEVPKQELEAARRAGTFADIVTPSRDAKGTLQVTYNIRLKP
jgi:protocatechuate 3,4-dioxygenase, beta subunit